MESKTELYKERVRNKYGEKYNLDYVKYINKHIKVKIICPIHGEINVYPLEFLKKGCVFCNKDRRIEDNKEKFIKKAKEIHGDKYDYSKVEYKNTITKVCIICPIHGEFWMRPTNHLRGQGCPVCGQIKSHTTKKMTTEEFIKRAKEIHSDKYDYSKVEYIGWKKKVCIICPTHGEFWQTPNRHFMGDGCPKCAKNYKLTQNIFIQRAKEIYGNKYDYSKVEYKNYETKVCIICPIHGEFWITPHHFLDGHGCSKCKESIAEKEVRNMLEENNIKYIYEANKKTLPWIGLQSLDFYLPEYNIAIECQGIQHFKPIGFFGGYKALVKLMENDRKKWKLCCDNNIKLYYYSKYNYPNMITDIKELLRKLRTEALISAN